MKRTLFRYLLTEISVPFALGMTVFSFVLLMGRFLKLVDLVVAKGVPLSDLARLLLYIFPSFCIITIPMALLLAVLLAFGRLSADSEVTAMKASGVSLAGLLPPVMTMAFVTFIICTFITIYALPWGNSSFRRLLLEIVQNRAALTIKERVFIDDFPGMVIYVDRYDQDRHQIHGILIHDERNTKEPSTIFAQTGLFYSDPMTRTLQLQLDNGEIHRSIGKNSYRHIVFDRYDLRITLNPISTESGRNEQDYSLRELFAGKKNTNLKPRERLDISIELHRRFALPFACFIFALVAVPLGLQNQRSGKAGGFSFSIAILLIYYVVLTGGKSLGEQGVIPLPLAMWLPNILFMAFGIYLFRYAATEREVPLLVHLRHFSGWLRNSFRSRRRHK